MNCELYFLGAGRPASGNKPSALKNIALNYKAMDWQLNSFRSIVQPSNTFFLGGYHIDAVAKNYPHLNFSVIPQWEEKSVLDTFFHGPFTGGPIAVTYSDTLFRESTIRRISSNSKDVVIAFDSVWEDRFSSRSLQDIEKAETLVVDGKKCEFTGLIYFSEKAVHEFQLFKASSATVDEIGNNLLDLIRFLERQELSIDFIDIQGDWAEFNYPEDISNFVLGTKSETLARLESLVESCHIGKQESFTAQQWGEDGHKILARIESTFGHTKLIVRSSSKSEDNWDSSSAGAFESILDVDSTDEKELIRAINLVVTSYGEGQQGSDQVLVQEFLQSVVSAGVVFTCTLESGAPYYRFNFDDKTQSTESVTAGTHSDLRTVLVSKFEPELLATTAPELLPVLKAVQELELLLGYDKLDIEYAIATDGTVHVFQVRPIVVNHDNYDIDFKKIEESIKNDVTRYRVLQSKSPFIEGEKTIFANMPDWNPAEIIGTKPKPLAFSLYQQLITNDVWALQRAEFGYRNVAPHPLIVSFSGQPYVDVRASLNSFLPATLSAEAASRIVTAYVQVLSNNPHFHDKIEFEVAFTVWTPNFRELAIRRLSSYGVLLKDIDELECGLKQITCNALSRLERDISSVIKLNERREQIVNSPISNIDKVYALLVDCRVYGTLAFAHAARAGFVAMTILKFLASAGGISDQRRLSFLNSFDTVAGEFDNDKNAYLNGRLSQEALIGKYGHLRPGTYEVVTKAYWEDPQQYILPTEMKDTECSKVKFSFTNEEKCSLANFLCELGSQVETNDLTQYLVEATQSREKVKFDFTKNLSKCLDYCIDIGVEYDLNRAEVSYLTYSDLENLKLNLITPQSLRDSIARRKDNYLLTKVIELPSLIACESQFYSFERLSSQPNFVGSTQIIGQLVVLSGKSEVNLTGIIVMVPQADPGYDWLFGHEIAGLITQYGGANSHMAIRSAEMGLPAAIGVGEKLYDTLLSAKIIELDCVNQVIRVIE
jgi:choline kinase/phosphohistidine swiveling domain-containing protein